MLRSIFKAIWGGLYHDSISETQVDAETGSRGGNGGGDGVRTRTLPTLPASARPERAAIVVASVAVVVVPVVVVRDVEVFSPNRESVDDSGDNVVCDGGLSLGDVLRVGSGDGGRRCDKSGKGMILCVPKSKVRASITCKLAVCCFRDQYISYKSRFQRMTTVPQPKPKARDLTHHP